VEGVGGEGIGGKRVVAHHTFFCDVLACIGDQLGAIALNRAGAVIVTFHGSFSPSAIRR
jgi:hypothetical protein